MWTDTLLKLTLDQERSLYLNPRLTPGARELAYRRRCAKQWFETLILAPTVRIDLNDLDPQDAAEVAQLRDLVGFHSPPWHRQELAA